LFLYLKMFILLLLSIRLVFYWRGVFSGIVINKLLVDFTYFGLALFVLFRNDIYAKDSIYVDIPLTIVAILFAVEMVFTIRMYIASKSFSLDSEKRLVYIVEYYLNKKKFEKCYKILSAHLEVLEKSSKLLIHLGTVHEVKNNYKSAFECFAEATELTRDEDVLLLASTKAFRICANELKDLTKAKDFINAQIIKDISPKYVQELEKLLATS
jgi:tetratricopeptide (TPR) repeat protein